MSLILAEKGVSFKQLGELALMGIPYVLKILIAPAVDSVSFSLRHLRIIMSSINHLLTGNERPFLFL